MARIMITGAEGTIGSTLYNGLAEQHDVRGLGLPKNDVTDYNSLLEQFQGFRPDTVIHAAHNIKENRQSGRIEPDNIAMEMNVFEAAAEASVARLIMASSVHADDFLSYTGKDLLTVPGSYKPASPYGAHKLIMEGIGRSYAQRLDMEFVALRLGGVTRDNSVRADGKEPLVWLSHADLLGAVNASIDAEEIPGGHAVFYAVSNNKGRLHDTSNPFGWTPQDNSHDHLHL